jgi:hypothetical protein
VSPAPSESITLVRSRRAAARAPAAARALTGLLLAALLLGPLASCRTIPFAEPDLSTAYGKVLQEYTRKAALFDKLETRAFVHMVYLTPEMAEAQAERLSELRGEPAQVAAERKTKARDSIRAPIFFAVVSTPFAQWNDLESKSSSWRVALGPEYTRTPVKIERFERPFAVDLLTLYPYLDDFHVGYRIEFAPPPVDRGAKLMVGGALGKMEFDWSVQP